VKNAITSLLERSRIPVILVFVILTNRSMSQCTPDFYASEREGEAPFTTTFHDNSTGATGWYWIFSQGNPSSWQGQNPPPVTYNQPGTYTVTLNIICGQNQQSRIRADYISVHEKIIRYDYGDAPEDQIAYPASGVIGRFPTCFTGSAGFIRHKEAGHTFLGHHADYERAGNGGYCPGFEPDMYNMDELCDEVESCLYKPDAFTILDGSIVPMCDFMTGSDLGYACRLARWGDNINIWYDTDITEGAYVNVIIDWNQDGQWGGASVCDENTAPEHVLKNFLVTGASNGLISVLDPPSFRIGPNSGYVWARITITDEPVDLPWDGGGGTFDTGETEDYLFKVASPTALFDFGDAPWSYMTLSADNGPRHQIIQGLFLGEGVSSEDDGKPTNDAQGDDDDGVTFMNEIIAGDTAQIQVIASAKGILKVWIDFNLDGDWEDKGEEALDTEITEGENALEIPIPENAKEGETYARFRYSGGILKGPDGPVIGGEIEDYLMEIERIYVYEFGDAPEGIMAYGAGWVEYTDEQVMGEFTTCGDYSRVCHGNRGQRYFGESVDYEEDGNAGCCTCGWDLDETCGDGDAGLVTGHVYSIIGEIDAGRPAHLGGYGEQMVSCGVGRWGAHLDIRYHCESEDGAYINVLVDWNMSGAWNDEGSMIFHCDDLEAPHLKEHIVQDLFVPQGSGYLSELDPPDFRTGGPGGYVWARFTISDTPVGTDEWTGHGNFADGETEDYLLFVARSDYRDYGDAPSGDVAYPSTGVIGTFPVCPVSGNTVRHGNETGVFAMFFGCSLCPPTTEQGGNRGLCRGAYNRDDDNGLEYTKAYTIDNSSSPLTVIEEYVPLYARNNTIGTVCQMAEWGPDNLDMYWANQTWEDWAYVNVLIDWNQDGEWGGTLTCEDGHTCDEHVLKNYRLPPAAAGSGLGAHRYDDPPDFRIGPNSGYVWARFTMSPGPVTLPWDGTGDFEDGETEDYLLKVGSAGSLCYMDFGDAWLGSTQNSDGGASHLVAAGFHLGDLIDPDGDGQPDQGASGDDNDGINDDDGVNFKNALVPGSLALITVKASAAGILSAWLDFNRNGTWEDGEDQIIKDAPLEEGENQLSFQIPAGAAPGTTYVRFRFSNVGGLSFSGPHFTDDPLENPEDLPPIGEVEDYAVEIEGDESDCDYSDAPDPRYPTLSASFGAWHALDGILFLGSTIDAEVDGLPTGDAMGDDTDGTDDEDGVQFHNIWTAADSAYFTVTVSDSGYLNAWADFNGDGDWNDTDEQIIRDDFIGPGSQFYDIAIPVTVYLDSTFARFRLSHTAGLSPTGYAPDGEVEDYFIAGISTEVDQQSSGLKNPEQFELMQNRPNPFNPDTKIQFTLPNTCPVRINVFNTRGQLVRVLMNETKSTGRYTVEWDGRDERGAQMSSGIYVCTLQAESFFRARKLLLIK
jgi:PKD repeat protein